MKPYAHICMVVGFLLFSIENSCAQTCNGNKPADTNCSSCTEVSDGDSFTDTRCATGTKTFNSATSVGSGGTLIVCGDLTMNAALTMSAPGSTIHVASGGSLTLSSPINLDGGRDIIVYGTIDGSASGADFQLQGSGGNNLWVMGTVAMDELVVNNTDDTLFLYDNSTTTADILKLQGAGGKMCMDAGVSFDVGRIEGNSTNGLVYGGPSGQKACLGYNGGSNQASLNSNLTADSEINICQCATCTCSPCNWNAATVNTNCANCAAFLPVDLIQWNVARWDNGMLATWTTASETNNSHFIIERSTDGKDFEFVATILGHGTTSDLHNYQFLDEGAPGSHYYRLTQVDYNGDIHVYNVVKDRTHKQWMSAIEQVSVGSLNHRWQAIMPTDKFQEVEVEIINALGQVISTQSIDVGNRHTLNLEPIKKELSAGKYWINVFSAEHQQRIKSYQGVVIN